MTRRVTLIDDLTGRLVTGKVPRRAKLIPFTPEPKTRAQRIKRALIG